MSEGSPLRLAYADPPYPGKAHLYPENEEVDHAGLISRLREYDGWALSTDERNLAYVLALCPPATRILAWCRSTAPPFLPYPYAAWEPVLCVPARARDVEPVRSYTETHAAIGAAQRDGLTGQKTPMFCEWVIRCMGARPGDSLDDLFPGTRIMDETFRRFQAQPPLFNFIPRGKRSHLARENMMGSESLTGDEPRRRERKQQRANLTLDKGRAEDLASAPE